MSEKSLGAVLRLRAFEEERKKVELALSYGRLDEGERGLETARRAVDAESTALAGRLAAPALDLAALGLGRAALAAAEERERSIGRAVAALRAEVLDRRRAFDDAHAARRAVEELVARAREERTAESERVEALEIEELARTHAGEGVSS